MERLLLSLSAPRYLLRLESGSQQELLVLLSDLDVVDFVLVEDHEGEGLLVQLPGAVPHQVDAVLHTHTRHQALGLSLAVSKW